jgi:hypothetical protein
MGRNCYLDQAKYKEINKIDGTYKIYEKEFDVRGVHDKAVTY